MTTNDPVQPESEPVEPAVRRRVAPGAKVAAPIIAALLVGAGAAFAVDHHSTTPTASAGGVSGPVAGAQDQGGPGGVAGEQHIQGTVTAKSGSRITVKSSAGTTATYTVDSRTQIVRNGQTASLSDVAVGDPVFVHVYRSSGQMLVERLFAGSSATDDGGGPGFGPPRAGSGTPGAGTGTPTHI
ncbi:MAG TPA: hypothetical protein VGF66_10760 [Gaiellaceae bacterium]|jgi:hypothetical protein